MEEVINPLDEFQEPQEEGFVSKLWMPPLHATSFEANGKTYYKANSISISRMRAYEKLTVGGVLDFKRAWDKLVLAKAHLNKGLIVDAGIELDKVMSGMVNIDEGEVQAVMICTLFWNIKDEDDRFYVHTKMLEKIEDWSLSGLDSQFFFQDAALSLPGFIAACKDRIQTSLKTEKI